MNKDAGELQKRAADSRARALAPMVEEIRAAGFTSCRSMAGELNRRHVPTFRRGKRWYTTTVTRLLARLG